MYSKLEIRLLKSPLRFIKIIGLLMMLYDAMLIGNDSYMASHWLAAVLKIIVR